MIAKSRGWKNPLPPLERTPAFFFSVLPHNKSGRRLRGRTCSMCSGASEGNGASPGRCGSMFAVASPPLENKPIMTCLVCLPPTLQPPPASAALKVISARPPRKASPPPPPPLCTLRCDNAGKSVLNRGGRVTFLFACESDVRCFCFSASASDYFFEFF